MTTEFVKNLFLNEHEKQLIDWRKYYSLKKEHQTTNPVDVKELCDALISDLSNHFDSEEVLYSKYQEKSDNLSNLIKDIRKDHKRMLDILNLLNSGKSAEDTLSLLVEFDAVLKNHIVVEETKLYPAIDSVLSDDEKSKVIIQQELDELKKSEVDK